MARLLKLTIDDRDGGVLTLPAFARILSVGFQKRRDAPKAPDIGTPQTPVRDDNIPKDTVPGEDDEVLVHFTVELKDNRSGVLERRNVDVDAGPDAENDVRIYYRTRGFEVVTLTQVQTPADAAVCKQAKPPSAPPVPVLWFEAPEVTALGVSPETWPMVKVAAFVVPTGRSAPNDAVFIGTLQRPAARNSDLDAVFHIYVERSDFLIFK